MLKFDEKYYRSVIEKYKYNPIDFQPINFKLGDIHTITLEKKWLCHHEADTFAKELESNGKCIVTTGIGLSGAPHMGTISQIMRAVFLQKFGLTVQFVLGDLDSYNARKQPLSLVKERVEQYSKFITGLGFDQNKGILRNQKGHSDILETAYIISNCLEDKDFMEAEEDLSELYKSKGIYPGIEFPVKQAILLMVSDFVHLGLKNNYKEILITLGLEEHLYVLLAQKVIHRMNFPFHISAMYSRVIKGLNGYPKMSKSIPGSAITVDMQPGEIKRMIIDNEGPYDEPSDSVVYQMMCSVSFYSPEELDELYNICRDKGDRWTACKSKYADILIDICERWPR